MAMTRSTQRASMVRRGECSGASVTTYGNADDDDATLSFPNASGDNKRGTLRKMCTEQDLWFCRSNFKVPVDERYKDRTEVSSCDDIAKVTISKLSPSDGGLYALCNNKKLCICVIFVITAAKTEPTNTAHEAGNDTIICPSQPVKAAVGDDVTLEYHLEPERDVTGELVEWKFNGSLNVVVYRSEGLSPDDQAEQFKNRATLVKEELGKGNLAVKISSVNTTDGGIYTCSVGGGISCDVRLNVRNDDIICPSQPVKAAVGDDVTLEYHLKSKRNVTGESVEWKFNGSFVIIYKNRGLSPDDQAEEFKGRAALDVGELRKGNLTVKISSVNTADGGNYTCSVGVEPQQISCNVRLTVENPAEQRHGTEMTTLQQPQNQQRDDNTAGANDANAIQSASSGDSNPENPAEEEDDNETENQEQQQSEPLLQNEGTPRQRKCLSSEGHRPSASEGGRLPTPSGEPNSFVFFGWKWSQNMIKTKRSQWDETEEGNKNFSESNDTEIQPLNAAGTEGVTVTPTVSEGNKAKKEKKTKHSQLERDQAAPSQSSISLSCRMPHQRICLVSLSGQTAFSVLAAILLTLHPCTGQSQDKPPQLGIVGDNIILPCYLKPPMDASEMWLEWARPDLSPAYVHVWDKNKERVDLKHSSFMGRTSLSIEKMKHGDISLNISQVKLSDEGTYSCLVPSLGHESFVQLIVEPSNKSEHIDTPSPENGNKDGIIGLSVVGSVVIAVLAVVLGFLIWKKCQHQNPAAPGNPVENIPLN